MAGLELLARASRLPFLSWATIALQVSNAVDLEVVTKQVKATIGNGYYRRRNERGWKDFFF